MRRRIWLGRVVLVALATSVGLAAMPAGAADTVKIGMATALTGPAATYGVAIRRAAQLAIDEINDKGGIKGTKLELVVRDSEHNPVKQVANARELVERQGVVALLGGTNSASMLAVAPILNDQLQVPVICPATDATKITENDAWDQGRDNYVFRYGMFGRAQSNFLVNMAVKMGYKRIGVFTWTAGWGVTGRGEINRRLGELNMKAVADETYDTADTDMTPQLLKLKESGAEAILNYGLVRENVYVVRTKEKIEDKTPYFSAWGLATPAFWTAAKESGEGVFVSSTLSWDGPQPPERLDFMKKLRERHGKAVDIIPSSFAAYDIVYLYAHVMDKVGTDPKAIRAGLEDIKSFKGLIKNFDRPVFTTKRHDALTEDDFVLARWTEGKFLQVHFDQKGPHVVMEGGTKRYMDPKTAALK